MSDYETPYSGVLQTVQQILERDGVRNQDGEIASVYNGLLLTRTNGNEIEVNLGGKTVLRVPLSEGTGRPVIFHPGVWMEVLNQ